MTNNWKYLYPCVDNLLDLDSLLILIRDTASKWEQMANELSVPKKEIEYIKRTTGGEDYDSLVEVCDWWIKWLYDKHSQATWRAVSKALKRIGYPNLAKEVMEIYKTGLCMFDTMPGTQSLSAVYLVR